METKNTSMGIVLTWLMIVALTSGLLCKYNINFNYIEENKSLLSMTDVLVTVFEEFLYFQFYQISILTDVWNLEIWEYWKYANLKIVEVLDSKIICFSMLKCLGFICM